MSSEAQKKGGYPLPADPMPEDTISFCITIPNDPAFRNAMYVQLLELGKWWNWKRDETRPTAASESAICWRTLFTLSEDCGGEPMSCEDVEDCLETSEIIADLAEQIESNAEDVDALGSGTGFKPSSPTKPLDQTTLYPQISEDIAVPESGCDDDDKSRLWGTIRALVSKINQYNLSLLNSYSTISSPQDAWSVLDLFAPIVGGLPPSTAQDLAVKLASNFKTSYNSAVTEAFLTQVAVDLFCDAYSDCSFSLEDAISYFAAEAGGSFDAATTTFLDVTSSLAGQTTGAGIFNALSWWQFEVLGLGEKFGVSPAIPNLIAAITGAALDDSWKAYADDCYTHSGTWTVVLDFAGDYVKTGSEVVYPNAWQYVKPSTTASQGTASLTQQYIEGMQYVATSNQFANRELRVLNSSALFANFRLNAKKTGGTSTNMLVDVESNTLANSPRQITSSSFAWTSATPISHVSGSANAITRVTLNFNQTLSSNSCQGAIRYIEFTGSGEYPQFG